MTIEGYRALENELKKLKNTDRPNVVKAIAEAREHGDLSENAEYHAAKELQSFIEGRIKELEYKIGRAEVIDISQIKSDKIFFGASVILYDENSDKEFAYKIVGIDEADLEQKEANFYGSDWWVANVDRVRSHLAHREIEVIKLI